MRGVHLWGACAEPRANEVGLWRFGGAGRCRFNQMRGRIGWRNGRPTRGIVLFGRQNSLDRNFVGSMGRKRGSEVGIRQRVVAAVSTADNLCGCCGGGGSLKIPGYKASSLRT